MQLADASSADTHVDIGQKLSAALKVFECLYLPQLEDRCVANRLREFFPLTSAASNKKAFCKMSKEKRMRLKRTLAEDVSPLLAAVGAAVGAEKRFNAEPLPADPVACMARIGELRAEKKRKIDELQLELEQLDEGELFIETLQKNQMKAATLSVKLGPMM
jgi:hypothetical protein